MEIFMNIMYLVVVFGVILYPGYMLTTEVYRLVSDGSKASTSIRLQGLVPIWNNIVIKRLLYGSAGKIVSIYIILIPIVAARIIAMITRSSALLTVTAILDLFGILLCWVIAAYIAIDVGRMVEVSGAKLVLCAIVPPLGCYVVARSIGPYIKHSGDELEDTFLEDE